MKPPKGFVQPYDVFELLYERIPLAKIVESDPSRIPQWAVPEIKTAVREIRRQNESASREEKPNLKGIDDVIIKACWSASHAVASKVDKWRFERGEGQQKTRVSIDRSAVIGCLTWPDHPIVNLRAGYFQWNEQHSMAAQTGEGISDLKNFANANDGTRIYLDAGQVLSAIDDLGYDWGTSTFGHPRAKPPKRNKGSSARHLQDLLNHKTDEELYDMGGAAARDLLDGKYFSLGIEKARKVLNEYKQARGVPVKPPKGAA